MIDYYYKCTKCGHAISNVQSDEMSVFAWCEQCENWVSEDYLEVVRIRGDDMGYCYKCNIKMCYALDGYHGTDNYAKHLCKECRYKYDRGLD